MASTKQILTKINSVKSTKKITKVMHMIAAAKVNQCRKRAYDVKLSKDGLHQMLSGVVSGCIDFNSLPYLIRGAFSAKKNLVILVASDKGLCGGFNAKLFRYALAKFEELSSVSEVEFISIGMKAKDFLIKNNFKIIKSINSHGFDYKDIEQISSLFVPGQEPFDSCSICFTEFENSVSQLPKFSQIFPLSIESDNVSLGHVCDGDINEVLYSMSLSNLKMQLYYAVSSSVASEYMSRMVAMDSATKNAEDAISKLTILYNRTRQAAITRDIVEIISGAEAL